MITGYHNTKEYSILLAEKAAMESNVFPIDRAFLNHHLNDILEFSPFEFVFHNFELGSILYSNQLFVCLPEVWQQINFDDLIKMCEQFTNIQSYFSLIKFTYKYIEIDIIEQILGCKRVQSSEFIHAQVIEYLEKQWNVLLKSESDLEDFHDGFIEVNYDEWMYIKQKFLLNNHVMPALLELEEMKVYISNLIKQR